MKAAEQTKACLNLAGGCALSDVDCDEIADMKMRTKQPQNYGHQMCNSSAPPELFYGSMDQMVPDNGLELQLM